MSTNALESRPPFLHDATPSDRPRWDVLWAGYLAHYNHTLPAEMTDLTWARVIDPSWPINMRVAEEAGRLIGFATTVLHPSTWDAGPSCYLEDLFVAEDARGRGIARMLIDDLIEQGRAKGWSFVYWVTEEENARARALYDSYALADGYVRYRLAL